MIKDQEFKPTSAMKLYAFQRAKTGDETSDKDIAKELNIWPETISRWRQDEHFLTWLADQISVYRAPIHNLLEQVAIERLTDFRYWEAIALKFGYIKEEEQDAMPIAEIKLNYKL